MKATGHPDYYQATVTCACGNTFTVGSVKPEIKVEICSKCHPFFTGEMRFVDTMGRVERFQQRMTGNVGRQVLSKKKRQEAKKKQEEMAEADRPKSIKEMFDKVKVKA
jgi:large subunit ribosomal protein L31